MDKMFEGVCVTGETSYVPPRRNGPHNISSEDDEDGGNTTPQSTGSKRSFSSLSTRSTGTSPSKKSRNPAARAMETNMRELNVILENRTLAQNQMWADRQRKLDEKSEMRQRVRNMAQELGVTSTTPLWVGLLKLCRSVADMELFEASDAEGRKRILEHLAGVGNI